MAAARGDHHHPAVGHLQRRRGEAGGGPGIPQGDGGEAGLRPPRAGTDTRTGPPDRLFPEGDGSQPHRHYRGRGGEGGEAEGAPGRHLDDRSGLRGRGAVPHVADDGGGGGGGVGILLPAGCGRGHAVAPVPA